MGVIRKESESAGSVGGGGRLGELMVLGDSSRKLIIVNAVSSLVYDLRARLTKAPHGMSRDTVFIIT